MVIVQVAGGLGNQLQQYALYYKLITLGREAKLDISWFTDQNKQEKVLAKRALELDYFRGLDYEVCTAWERKQLIGSEGLAGKIRRKLLPVTIHRFAEQEMYHPEVLQFAHMYVTGYFACEKYYEDILGALREKIQFPPSSNPKNRKTAEEMRGRTSVSVHIRRGDYLDQENSKLFGNICTEAYYAGGMAYIEKRFPDVHFYLFSDDMAYVREHYKGENHTLVDWNQGRDSFYDMWLMSQCKHNICANSTFSFWGARLNGHENKIMIRPTVHKNTQVFDGDVMRELWSGWRLVDQEGRLR